MSPGQRRRAATIMAAHASGCPTEIKSGTLWRHVGVFLSLLVTYHPCSSPQRNAPSALTWFHCAHSITQSIVFAIGRSQRTSLWQPIVCSGRRPGFGCRPDLALLLWAVECQLPLPSSRLSATLHSGELQSGWSLRRLRTSSQQALSPLRFILPFEASRLPHTA